MDRRLIFARVRYCYNLTKGKLCILPNIIIKVTKGESVSGYREQDIVIYLLGPAES
ncbi:hypothetical protein Ga0466249_002161 [Sporomusaceae bacterium BoRhaA]|nr:hypothetical protein [Pelorhabdus rhamnosifermentans]